MKGIVIVVLFVGCLIVVGQCCSEPECTDEDSHANVTSLVSYLDESKVTLKWCVERDCKSKGEAWTLHRCICCMTLRDQPCYHSYNECEKNCPPS
ncbi:hypothetical protein ZWY2020_044467 [Hordeum vulgare]|nr:hypothetical protein ZWY2020_044467 [Hordeum vulgare]